MKRLLDLLGSLRLTLGLLLALGGLFALGLVVPQKAVLKRELFEQWSRQSPTLVRVLDAIGLTDVYRSSLAAVLWVAFFLNLVVVMVRRVPGTRRRVRIDGEIPDPATAPGLTFRRRLAGAPGAIEPVRDFFEGRGFAVHVDGERLRAVRNRFAPAATLLFHLSFFVVAAGALVSAATRFEGRVDLGSGEEFTGALEQYASRPLLPRFGEPPKVRFTVEGIEPEVVGNLPVAVRVFLRDQDFLTRVVEVNRPYEVGHTSFVFVNLGVAPALLITDVEGHERFAGLVKLNILQDRVDRFEVLGVRFTARFFPDYVRDGGIERSRSQEVRDPVLRLDAETRTGGRVSASLRPGDRMALGPYTVTFAEWRYWTRLYVRSERGMRIVWTGFALGALALVGRLVLFRREYLASVSGEGVFLAGRAEYYRHLFEDEAGEIARALEEVLTAAVPPGE